jgi:hypothetical protein
MFYGTCCTFVSLRILYIYMNLCRTSKVVAEQQQYLYQHDIVFGGKVVIK